jgi:DNA segregation ATPase FtsK/SpoIIIE, S-DNA-T family
MSGVAERQRTAADALPGWRRGPRTPGEPGRLPVVELRVVGGPSAGRRVPLEPGEHRVGGHRYSRVVLTDPALARVHLVLRVDPGSGVIVAPAGPDTSCLVDGERLAGPVRLRPGQLLAAGRSLLTVGRPGDGAPAPGPEGEVAATRIEAPSMPLVRGGGVALGFAAAATALVAGVAGGLWGPPAALVPVGLAPLAGAGALAWTRHGNLEARARFRAGLVELDRALAGARRARLARCGAAVPDAAEVLFRLEAGRRWPLRRPGHPDWLRLRVGWADPPSGLGPVVAPRGAPALRNEALRVAVRHVTLRGAPVGLSLGEAGPLGIAGDPVAGLALARWLAVQVAALHEPGDVVLAAALPAGLRRGFGWLPSLALGREEAARLVARLAALVVERSAAREAGPAVVAILHCGVVDGVARALTAGRRVGVHVVWLAADEQRRPSCPVVLDLPSGGAAPTLWVTGEDPLRLGGADGLTAALAARTAAALHPLTIAAPARPALTDALGTGGRGEHDVLTCWIRDRASPAPRGLRAALGMDPFGRPVDLDLRRARRPVLITGDGATGKSELLRCLVASLAVRHAPRTLNLLLIGAAPDAFRGLGGLPHALDLLARPDEARLRRVAGRLQGELRWRRASPRATGAPGLVVAIDEPPAPAEAGGLLDALAAIARRGPDLGVHLLVAAREPAALEALLGPAVRIVMGAPGAPAVLRERGGRAQRVRPAAGDGVEALARAIVAANRTLAQPARARWPHRGRSLQSSR